MTYNKNTGYISFQKQTKQASISKKPLMLAHN
jgi:hypothetical protein